MFLKNKYLHTMIPRNKQGKRKLCRRVSRIELVETVNNTYKDFCSGQSASKILQAVGIAKCHVSDYNEIVLNKFLAEFDGNCDTDGNIKKASRFANLTKKTEIDLGFIYCLKINDKIKFGKTRNFKKRMQTYKSHNGVHPEVLILKFCIHHSDVERRILKLCNSKTEWFSIDYVNVLTKIINNEIR